MQQRHTMPLGKAFERSPAQHFTMFIDELAQGARRFEPSQSHQVDRCLGVAASLEYSAWPSP
jgi:hypothetical protein